ncbi:MAG: hypothetical protein M0Z66_06080 [Thermaerobacter sp.]|nr:hypothetical protein [Thermaerobacter sp.]
MAGIFGPVQDMLAGALEGLSMRSQIVAQNISNLGTPGYQAQDVRFAATLQQALQTGSVNPQVVAAPGAMNQSGNGVDLEQQLGLLNQIALVQQGVMSGIDETQKGMHQILQDLGGPGV